MLLCLWHCVYCFALPVVCLPLFLCLQKITMLHSTDWRYFHRPWNHTDLFKLRSGSSVIAGACSDTDRQNSHKRILVGGAKKKLERFSFVPWESCLMKKMCVDFGSSVVWQIWLPEHLAACLAEESAALKNFWRHWVLWLFGPLRKVTSLLSLCWICYKAGVDGFRRG